MLREKIHKAVTAKLVEDLRGAGEVWPNGSLEIDDVNRAIDLPKLIDVIMQVIRDNAA